MSVTTLPAGSVIWALLTYPLSVGGITTVPPSSTLRSTVEPVEEARGEVELVAGFRVGGQKDVVDVACVLVESGARTRLR